MIRFRHSYFIDPTNRKGCDQLQEERYTHMQDIGLIGGDHWKLTSRSLVPVDKSTLTHGYSGQPNPAWEEVPQDRQKDLARRMAVFAAMVESVDQGVGHIVEHLKLTDDYESTLILFLSDNGACYEWGPWGFDGPSRRGTSIPHQEEELRKIGGPGTNQSYGSSLINLGTPPSDSTNMSPMKADWPLPSLYTGHTVSEPFKSGSTNLVGSCRYDLPGPSLQPAPLTTRGRSLLGLMHGQPFPDRSLGFDHQGAKAWREGDWKLVWSNRMPHEIQWEL